MEAQEWDYINRHSSLRNFNKKRRQDTGAGCDSNLKDANNESNQFREDNLGRKKCSDTRNHLKKVGESQKQVKSKIKNRPNKDSHDKKRPNKDSDSQKLPIKHANIKNSVPKDVDIKNRPIKKAKSKIFANKDVDSESCPKKRNENQSSSKSAGVEKLNATTESSSDEEFDILKITKNPENPEEFLGAFYPLKSYPNLDLPERYENKKVKGFDSVKNPRNKSNINEKEKVNSLNLNPESSNLRETVNKSNPGVEMEKSLKKTKEVVRKSQRRNESELLILETKNSETKRSRSKFNCFRCNVSFQSQLLLDVHKVGIHNLQVNRLDWRDEAERDSSKELVTDHFLLKGTVEIGNQVPNIQQSQQYPIYLIPDLETDHVVIDDRNSLVTSPENEPVVIYQKKLPFGSCLNLTRERSSYHQKLGVPDEKKMNFQSTPEPEIIFDKVVLNNQSKRFDSDLEIIFDSVIDDQNENGFSKLRNLKRYSIDRDELIPSKRINSIYQIKKLIKVEDINLTGKETERFTKSSIQNQQDNPSLSGNNLRLNLKRLENQKFSQDLSEKYQPIQVLSETRQISQVPSQIHDSSQDLLESDECSEDVLEIHVSREDVLQIDQCFKDVLKSSHGLSESYELSQVVSQSQGCSECHEPCQGCSESREPSQGLSESHESSQGLSESHESSQGLSESHESSQGLSESHESSQGLSESHESSQGLSESHESSQGLSESYELSQVVSQSQGCSECHEPCQGLSESHESSQGLSESHKSSQGLSESHESSQGLSESHESSQGLSESHESSQGLSESHESSQGLLESHEPSQCLSESNKPSQVVSEGHKASQGLSESHEPSHGLSESNSASQFVSESNSASQFVSESNSASQFVSESNSASQFVSESNSASQFVSESNSASQFVSESNSASQFVSESNSASLAVSHYRNKRVKPVIENHEASDKNQLSEIESKKLKRNPLKRNASQVLSSNLKDSRCKVDEEKNSSSYKDILMQNSINASLKRDIRSVRKPLKNKTVNVQKSKNATISVTIISNSHPKESSDNKVSKFRFQVVPGQRKYSSDRDKNQKCPFCKNDVGNTKWDVKKHVLQNHPHKCFLCKKLFETVEEFTQHKYKTHTKQMHECLVCDDYFKSYAYYLRHMKSFVHKQKELIGVKMIRAIFQDTLRIDLPRNETPILDKPNKLQLVTQFNPNVTRISYKNSLIERMKKVVSEAFKNREPSNLLSQRILNPVTSEDHHREDYVKLHFQESNLSRDFILKDSKIQSLLEVFEKQDEEVPSKVLESLTITNLNSSSPKSPPISLEHLDEHSGTESQVRFQELVDSIPYFNDIMKTPKGNDSKSSESLNTPEFGHTDSPVSMEPFCTSSSGWDNFF